MEALGSQSRCHAGTIPRTDSLNTNVAPPPGGFLEWVWASLPAPPPRRMRCAIGQIFARPKAGLEFFPWDFRWILAGFWKKNARQLMKMCRWHRRCVNVTMFGRQGEGGFLKRLGDTHWGPWSVAGGHKSQKIDSRTGGRGRDLHGMLFGSGGVGRFFFWEL